jgi:hypothetical protein
LLSSDVKLLNFGGAVKMAAKKKKAKTATKTTTKAKGKKKK